MDRRSLLRGVGIILGAGLAQPWLEAEVSDPDEDLAIGRRLAALELDNGSAGFIFAAGARLLLEHRAHELMDREWSCMLEREDSIARKLSCVGDLRLEDTFGELGPGPSVRLSNVVIFRDGAARAVGACDPTFHVLPASLGPLIGALVSSQGVPVVCIRGGFPFVPLGNGSTTTIQWHSTGIVRVET